MDLALKQIQESVFVLVDEHEVMYNHKVESDLKLMKIYAWFWCSFTYPIDDSRS